MTRKDAVADNALCKALIECEASSSIELPHLGMNIWNTDEIDTAEGVIRVNAGTGSSGVNLSVAMESEEEEFDVGAMAMLSEEKVLELIRYLIITTQFDEDNLITAVKKSVSHRDERIKERKGELGIK